MIGEGLAQALKLKVGSSVNHALTTLVVVIGDNLRHMACCDN
jgi:hypothetical protein